MNAFAENRANDLVRALASPTANEGMLELPTCPVCLERMDAVGHLHGFRPAMTVTQLAAIKP